MSLCKLHEPNVSGTAKKGRETKNGDIENTGWRRQTQQKDEIRQFRANMTRNHCTHVDCERIRTHRSIHYLPNIWKDERTICVNKNCSRDEHAAHIFFSAPLIPHSLVRILRQTRADHKIRCLQLFRVLCFVSRAGFRLNAAQAATTHNNSEFIYHLSIVLLGWGQRSCWNQNNQNHCGPADHQLNDEEWGEKSENGTIDSVKRERMVQLRCQNFKEFFISKCVSKKPGCSAPLPPQNRHRTEQ